MFISVAFSSPDIFELKRQTHSAGHLLGGYIVIIY